MGAENSSVSKQQYESNNLPNINGNGLVKLRIRQFDRGVKKDNSMENKKRHKSISENNLITTKDYYRSKSLDLINRDKNQYSRSRQISPKIYNNFTIYESLTRKSFNNDLDSNLERRLSEDIDDQNKFSRNKKLLAGIRNNIKISDRFNISDSTSFSLENDSTSLDNKNIRSVKNIKMIFENGKISHTNDNEVNVVKSSCADKFGESHNNRNNTILTENVPEIHSSSPIDLSNDVDFQHIQNKFKVIDNIIEEMKGRNDKSSNINLQENDVFECYRCDNTEKSNLYLDVHSSSVLDHLKDDFGQRSLYNLECEDFIEAYNRVGDELIITPIGEVKHREIISNLRNDKPVIVKENMKYVEKKHPAKKFDPSFYFTNEELDVMISENEARLTDESNIEQRVDSTFKIMNEDKEMGELQDDIELTIRHHSVSKSDNSIKTETTIYDSFKNPRISKVSIKDGSKKLSKTESLLLDLVELNMVTKNSTNFKAKKDYLIEELIDTERIYIGHLRTVVLDYMPYIVDQNLSTPLIGNKSQYIFGNIKKIYNITQQFYEDLKQCINDHESIAQTFLNYEHLFASYSLYMKNKPLADQYLLGEFNEIITERQRQLGDRLGLASNLLTPIQRLGKYILFLEEIQKELLRIEGYASNNVYKAIKIVRKQMSRGNDYVAIDSIKNSQINLMEQGSFLMREKFLVIKPKKYETMLFLFEEVLVFTTVDPKNSEMFIYRESIKLNEMGIVTFDDQPLIFHLKRFPSYKKGPKEHHEFVIEAKKNKDKKTWTEQIEKRLWEQLVKCKEEQRELHNNQENRNSNTGTHNRLRNKRARYRSLPNDIRKRVSKSKFYCNLDTNTPSVL